MDSNTLFIQRAAGDSQLQEVMLYIFGHLSPSHIFENEEVLAAFRGFIERASDCELSKLSLVKKVNPSAASPTAANPTPSKINTKFATTIIINCVDALPTKIDSQNFWQKRTKAFDQLPVERSPIIRFRRIESALSKVDFEAGITNRILKVLLSFEYENALLEYNTRHNDATATATIASKDINAYMTKALDIDVKRLRCLRTEGDNYLALMLAFGPGILFVLGGTKSTWDKLSDDACIVVELYLRNHLHKVIELAASLNFIAAKIIYKGMLLVGTSIDIIALEKTKLGFIILKFIEVLHDGTLASKESPNLSSREYEEKHWEAVKYIHSILPTPPSSRESTPADNRSATPEASTHDSDTVSTPTEYNATFSSSRSQHSGPGLFTFESRGRKRPREIDNNDDELLCDGGRYDNTEVSLSDSCPRRTISDTIGGEAAVSHDSSAELQAESSSVIPQSSGEEQTPSVQLDLAVKRDDANQTGSRERRGGIDTRQAEKIVEIVERAVSTHDSSADTQTDPFSVIEAPLAETAESPELLVSTGRDAVSTHEAVDSSCHAISSEPTSLTDQSTFRETLNQWNTGAGLDYNLQFQTINHEPSTEQAASVLYGIRNQEAGLGISHSLQQNFEVLRQPIQQFQQSETTHSFNFYDRTPLMTIPTQPPAERTVQQFQQSETTQSFNFYDQTPLMTIPTQPPAERTVQDRAQSYVPCGSQGFEEIHFDTRHSTDPHGFDAISFDSHGNAWFAKDSQGFEQVSFNSQNRIWRTAPSQGFEFISFNENHTAMSL